MSQRNRGCRPSERPFCWCQMKTGRFCRRCSTSCVMSLPWWRRTRWRRWTWLFVWDLRSSTSAYWRTRCCHQGAHLNWWRPWCLHQWLKSIIIINSWPNYTSLQGLDQLRNVYDSFWKNSFCHSKWKSSCCCQVIKLKKKTALWGFTDLEWCFLWTSL